MTYKEAENYILEIPKFTKKHTLENTKKLLDALHVKLQGRIIHVAGTNGKGSVCAYLCALLETAGYRVGMFTSPHLVSMRERIRIGGKNIDEQAFLKAFERVRALSVSEEEAAHPTFFEFLFLLAMVYFHEEQPDFVILETGLGGRLDATNAVEEKALSVITRIGLDHTEYLGDTLLQIAGEKAGILRKNVPVVYWETDCEIADFLQNTAKKLEIPAFPVSNADYEILKIQHKSIDFSYRSLYYDSIRLRLNTIAGYQPENASLALRAAEVLFAEKRLSGEKMKEALSAAFWAGRMEEIFPEVYVDGAHNPDGVRAFLETVAKDGVKNRQLFLGVMKDKDYRGMLKEIADSGLFDRISAVQLPGVRAFPAHELAAIIEKYTGKPADRYPCAEAVLSLLQKQGPKSGRAYIAGSLYLVGEIKALTESLITWRML